MTHVTERPFGKLEGSPVKLFILRNARGMEVGISNFGGIITSILVPGRDGRMADVVLGFDNLEGYLGGHPFFGAIIGRFGNRIAGGSFVLDGVRHSLPVNNAPNTLHGGTQGFDKKLWDAQIVNDGIKLSYISPDGEMGFPGTLRAEVTYTLSADNAIVIDYRASTDKPTVVNLTNHSYFNLAGHDSGDILAQRLMIDAEAITPVDASMIPTGRLMPVADTPFDFRQPQAIGARIAEDHEQLKLGGGYDHNFVVNEGETTEPALIARAVDPASGRVLEVFTTEPGVQLYTGNFLDGSLKGKGGAVYNKRGAFCLETQHFPDSPNQPDFPSTLLVPGEEYRSRTVYRFAVER